MGERLIPSILNFHSTPPMSRVIINPFSHDYIARTAVLNGSAGVQRAFALAGISDGKQVTFSMWIKLTDSGTDGTNLRIFAVAASGNTRFGVSRLSDNTFQFFGRNSAGTDILNVQSPADFTANDLWHHVYGCMDLADTGKRKIYIDGQSVSLTVNTWVNDNMDMNPSTTPRVMVGHRFSTPNDWFVVGEMAEVWFHNGYLDDPEAFRTPHGRPRDLGSDGSRPLGSQPRLYLRSGASFGTNSGSGGDITTTVGTITEGILP